METFFEDTEFGRVEIWRNERAKRIKILIKPDHLRITLPQHSSHKQALAFLNEVRVKIKQKQQKVSTQSFVIDEDHPLQTLSFRCKIKAANREKVFFKLSEGILLIEYPQNQNCQSNQMQDIFRKGILFFLRKEAKRLLPERLNQLAKMHHFTFKDLKIQSSKTRWGSCSSKKNINLSLYLLLMPPHLIDYVLLHELCHTVEMNHGESFWRLMDKVTNNTSKELRKQVKKYRCAL